jgi:multicomponent Na+:H+ antiporter subunit F
MNSILIAMILALLIPIYHAWQDNNIWQKILAYTSIASKISLMMLIISVQRDDWSIGVVAVIILSIGQAGLMLLAHLIKRLNIETNDRLPLQEI